ncbi:HEPN domain-containing protein [Parasphingopyxis algicola]|uniref:HEPN domain-containing protein n=1 Tax=Parasphingopyxis algicola TaxID=2026624 RepID=UPI0015A4E2C0|nr:HEPN domain-containing protein [Parasphingopyxis algicola]QLC24892.1 HEPN domain-containing protein [Parasphingopyxis algicola]
MRRDIDHLPLRKQIELERVEAILHAEFDEALKASTKPAVRRGRILKIILFGSHARGEQVEDAKGGYFSDYDLLIIVNDQALADMSVYWYAAEDRMLRDPEIRTPVSFIVHSLEEVNSALGQGQYFFSDIVRDGIALYELRGTKASGNSRFRLIEPKPQTPEVARKMAQDYFDQSFSGAQDFLHGYADALQRGNLNKAAFDLHQAVERLYTTVLLTLTLYGPKTHNIKFLRSLAEEQDTRLIDAWPRATKQDRRLFELLKRAYVEARYSKHYTITADELAWLGERAEALKSVVETICTEALRKDG